MEVLMSFSNLRRLCKYSMKMSIHGVDFRYVCTDPALGRNVTEYLDCDEFSCPYCEIDEETMDEND